MVSLFKAQLVVDWSQTIYNMENNPLYEMSKGHKTQTPVPAAPEYETVDSGRVCFFSVGGMNEVSQTKCCF